MDKILGPGTIYCDILLEFIPEERKTTFISWGKIYQLNNDKIITG
jgi:hypothetical protein